MATVTAFIRASRKKGKKVNVRFRLSDGRKIQLYHKSEIKVLRDNWDSGKQIIKAKVLVKAEEKTAFNKEVSDRKNLISEIYDKEPNKEELESTWLDQKVDERLHPDKFNLGGQVERTIFDLFDEFLQKHRLSEVRKNNYRVVKRILQRFELYTQAKVNQDFKLSLEIITPGLLSDIENFLINEHKISSDYPAIYEAVPETRTPQKRGLNTINLIFAKIRTFCIWAMDEGIVQKNPFRGFKVPPEAYGTPYYISIDERNNLFNTDLSDRPQLAVQRDIFVFQCLIGCRVSDLYKLVHKDVIDGAIQYIPRKTKDGRPLTLTVPLNKTALEILDRYPGEPNDPLFPFISSQKYNKAIKEAFYAAGITRLVTILNPTTREEEKCPINEIASSHLARRCFVGNLYKKVKNQDLVASLSGHKDGSKAFARYRDIDDEMKRDLVNLLD